MSHELALLLHLPTDWTDRQAEILAVRLVGSELPPGVTVECAYWDRDEQAYNPWWKDESR